MAYTAIQTQTLTSAESVVIFSSIPQTFRDLYLTIEGNSSGSSGGLNMRFNDVSVLGAYSTVELNASGSSVSSNRHAPQQIPIAWLETGSRTFATIEILNYSGTVNNKTSIARIGNASQISSAQVYRFNTTSGITSIRLFHGSASFAVGSSFSLWGVSA